MKHLDRCLTCLACETTCPSGVEYGDLVDLGRKHLEKAIDRPKANKFKRRLIISIFSSPKTNSTYFKSCSTSQASCTIQTRKKNPCQG